MGNQASEKKKVDVLNHIMGAPIYILKIDTDKVIKRLVKYKVPPTDAAKISEDIGLKAITVVGEALALIPGFEVAGGVIAVTCELIDLLSTDNQESFNQIAKQIEKQIAQELYLSHYTTIRANLKTITQNIADKNFHDACETAHLTLNEVDQKLKSGVLKSWYDPMGNKASLQLLVLYYKANVQIVQMLSQALKKIDPAQKPTYEKYLKDYLYLLKKLKVDIVEYRLTLLSFKDVSGQSAGQGFAGIIPFSLISDKGQDAQFRYDGKLTKEFQQFKDKTKNKVRQDLDSIGIL